MSSRLSLMVSGDGAPVRVDVQVDTLIIAGWAGRDQDAVEHHIAELAALGVRRPSSTPCFYRLAPALLSQDDAIDVVGQTSSGEAECVLVRHGDDLFVSIGSDHTDREVEAYGVTVSKQVCAKPVAREAWRFADVAAHWDRLTMRSWVTKDGERRLYQEGNVDGLLSPQELMAKLGPQGLPAGAAMFCGTLAAIGGVAGGEQFEIELHDPVLGRTIRHCYATRALAIAD
ncbi:MULTISPECIES: DUF2848 domain-containing protein [Pandoraea]|uniref:DUF2848 domain-containing protein n=1 Tax=Pandoraea capi TaxID=2508286 RepID=A0ABY6VXB7_9BURK|nr:MULTISPECIES: DUF2848 domain-containing protein [Pandoraea]ODP31001.1 hypothetical protein A9762_08105 [Pandoraea sp. ISTKB]VVE00112.1 hypothetical protein PCA20602_02089 [Pandoraea capi]